MMGTEGCFVWRDGEVGAICVCDRWWDFGGIDMGGIGNGRGAVVREGLGSVEWLARKGRELMDNALRKEGPRLDGLLLVSAALLMNWW